jgi:cytochrome c oxidase subunit 2
MAAKSHGENQVNPIEKGVILTSVWVSIGFLAMIGAATWALGITVPGHLPHSKDFDQASVIRLGAKNYEIHYLARMWAFEPRRVQVPPGSTLNLYITSRDVTHGFEIAGTNVNMMAIPGAVTSSRVHFERPGIYSVVCHEYCGAGHDNMSGTIEVTGQVTDISAAGIPVTGAPPAAAPSAQAEVGEAREKEQVEHAEPAGEELLEAKGCIACHSLDGRRLVGPTLKGLWGRRVEFSDGTSQIADDTYFRESVLDPSKKIVKGYTPVMPQMPVTNQEIDQMIDYLKKLK